MKTYEEIMYEINRLDADNYEEIIISIPKIEDTVQRNQLYDAFIKELKNQVVNKKNYNEELLESEIIDIFEELLKYEPEIEKVFIDNQFDLESIKNDRAEIANKKEIDKIEERISELKSQYMDFYQKESLLTILNNKLNETTEEIEKVEKEIENYSLAAIKERDEQYLFLLDRDIEKIISDIKTIEDKYNELSSEEIEEIIKSNKIKGSELEEGIALATTKSDEEILDYYLKETNEELQEIEAKQKEEVIENNRISNTKDDKENENEEVFDFKNASLEELKERLEELKKEKNEVWPEISDSISNRINDDKLIAEDVMFRADEIYHEINIIELELQKRELLEKKNKITSKIKKDISEFKKLSSIKKAYYDLLENGINKDYQNEENLEEVIQDNHIKSRQLEDYENSEKLKRELLEEINQNKNIEHEENEEIEQMFMERKEKQEKNKKLWLKALAATAGFATGLAASCVPGVGTIKMGIAATKLTVTAVNFVSDKFPKGKIATVRNNISEKLESKYPSLVEGARKMREKLKQTPLNYFLNGMAAGYLTGNVIEALTGETVFENVKDMFNSEPNSDVVVMPDIPTEEPILPEQTPVVNDDLVTPQPTPTPTPLPEVEDIPLVNEEVLEAFIPKQGEVYDLSALAHGLVSSTSNDTVDLIQSLGKEVVFDKAIQLPDGKIMWHFKQLNGAGYAWFNSIDVQELMSKASEVVSKTL